LATPLLVALVVIETTDLIFALDSIPAVLAVTRDPFLVYVDVFALLGLRSVISCWRAPSRPAVPACGPRHLLLSSRRRWCWRM
jgi:hypothetical protein